MTAEQQGQGRWMLAVGLVVVGALARLLPHPPNMTPLVAVALFGGSVLPKGLGIVVPVLAIFASDLAIGLHDVMAFTWGSASLTAMLGWWVRRRPRPGRIACAAVLGSTLFFLVANFGVWLIDMIYPRTWPGLAACYVAALPFFRNALIGDLAYTVFLFGFMRLAEVRFPTLREPTMVLAK